MEKPKLANSNVILITGGSGMIGSQAKFGIKPTRKQLDILNEQSIERAIQKYQPKTIVHFAALVDMLECEKNPKKAFLVNVTGTKNIAEACKKHKIKMVYLSTCAVFNGRKRTPFIETDKPNPVSVYGKTKLQGELVVQKLLPNALIIRPSWLFGSNVKSNKKFFQKAKEGLKKSETITGITDRLGSPTYIPDLLETLQKLIIKNSSGIFHVTNSGLASYFDIATEMKRIGKFKGSVVPQKYLHLKNPAVKRGKMEGLNSKKIKLRSWQAAIKNYVLNN